MNTNELTKRIKHIKTLIDSISQHAVEGDPTIDELKWAIEDLQDYISLPSALYSTNRDKVKGEPVSVEIKEGNPDDPVYVMEGKTPKEDIHRAETPEHKKSTTLPNNWGEIKVTPRSPSDNGECESCSA